MDGAFRYAGPHAPLSLVDAATVCSTTPARELQLVGHGVLAEDAVADSGRSRPDLEVDAAEYYGLSEAETRTVVEASARALAGRAPLVVGVGGAPVAARRATEHAGEAGADAVMVHHPANPYVTAEGLHAYYRGIAEVGLPVVPYVKAPVVTPEELVRIAAEPWVVAVKYAVNDLPAFAAAVAAAVGRADVVWVCGTAERWAPFFFAAGADGFTSGLVNITGGPSRALLDALRSGDRQAALDAWSSILPFEAAPRAQGRRLQRGRGEGGPPAARAPGRARQAPGERRGPG